MKRITKVGIGLAVVIGGIIFAVNRAKRATNAPVQVSMDTVVPRDLFATVMASGKIDAKSRADVSSEVTGRILKLHVREGDLVTRGQLLVELDPSQYSAAVDRVKAQLVAGEASLSQARTNRDQARRNLERMQELQRTAPPGSVTPAQIEELQQQLSNAEASFQSGQAQLQQTRASLKESEDNLGRTKLYAPISGRVVKLAVEEGEVAQPGTFSRDVGMLMRIADLSVVQAKVKVDETNLIRLALGDSAVVSIDAFPDTTFVGRVTRISNSAITASGSNDQAVNFEVELTIDNPPSQVRPDLSMTARIITDTRKQVLSIPIIALTARSENDLSAAVGRNDDAITTPLGDANRSSPLDSAARERLKEKEGVFVVNNGVARFRAVRIGITGEEFFEVLDGLRLGDTVVSGSYTKIRDMRDSTRVTRDAISN